MLQCERCGHDLEVVVVDLRPLSEDIEKIKSKLDRMDRSIAKKLGEIMTKQDDIDALVAAINNTVTDLAAAATNISNELQALKDAVAAAGAPIDTTGLEGAVAQLQQVQASLDSLETPPTSA